LCISIKQQNNENVRAWILARLDFWKFPTLELRQPGKLKIMAESWLNGWEALGKTGNERHSEIP
jgi:hypothetical protein